MDEKKSHYKPVNRKITIKTTDGSTFAGKVNIGVHDRVSDIFTRSDTPFVILFDAEHKESSGKIFFINKSHILWAEPDPSES